ncbi:DUF3365 domain-containing protein [Vulgatibacter sp.]|uniref:Tll0287-like domain-containing protein n=1 Tax=Vulgatibacter sp. TaxID=1971226 RepID=UPI003565B698
MRTALLLPLLLAACSTAASGVTPEAPPPRQLDPTDSALAERLARADAAIRELGSTLGARLAEAIGSGGPASAVEVCSTEAQVLTARIAAAHGVRLGRTSHKLRNPANAPRPWVKPWLARHAGGPAASAQPAVFDLGGDRIGVVRPIATQPLCTLCHGESIDPSVQEALRERYPADRATGFAVGELRGAFQVEVAPSRTGP